VDANRFDNPFLAPLAFLAVGSLTGETFPSKLALMVLGAGSGRDANMGAVLPAATLAAHYNGSSPRGCQRTHARLPRS